MKSLLFWLVLVVAGLLIWNFATRYDARDHNLSFSEFMAAVEVLFGFYRVSLLT
ncbi:MAG: hypothetical protein QM736_27365, partial [Vicinamibacterales bacterium]